MYAFLHVQKGPPFGLYVKKIVDVKFFGNFKKKFLKWPTKDLSNIKRNKVMKNQIIRGIPRGLAYNNQPEGVFLTPPCRIGLTYNGSEFMQMCTAVE